jgi:hypothetical protein
MAKKLTLFSLRLMMLNFVSIFIMLLLSMWQNNIYQWAITIFLTFVLMYFVWRDSETAGQKDIHNDKIIKKRVADGYTPSGYEGRAFKKWFGFAAGLLAQVPAAVLLIIACVSPALNGIVLPIAKLWYFSYISIITIIPAAAVPYFMFLFVVLFSLIAGLAYLNGPSVDRKIEIIIERNKAKKPRLVQDEWKAAAKKKGGQKKPAYKR